MDPHELAKTLKSFAPAWPIIVVLSPPARKGMTSLWRKVIWPSLKRAFVKDVEDRVDVLEPALDKVELDVASLGRKVNRHVRPANHAPPPEPKSKNKANSEVEA